MKIRVVRWPAGLVLMMAMVIVPAIGAQAVPAPKTTGSVGLSSPTQYIAFDAFDTTPAKGNVSYTNFEFPVAGTGVWVPAGTFDVDFYLAPYGGPFTHTLTVAGYEPTSPTSVSFWGTGFYYPNPSWTETFTGTVSGNTIALTLVPDDGGLLYQWTETNLTGTIAPDGSIGGTWSDDIFRADVFSIDAGFVHEVFHYVAPVTAADVTAPDAWFEYTIPDVGGLGGLVITWYVHDGGSPGAGNDSIGFTANGGGLNSYSIVSGNLTVFA